MLIIIKVAVYSKMQFSHSQILFYGVGLGVLCWFQFKAFGTARAVVTAATSPPDEGSLLLQLASLGPHFLFCLVQEQKEGDLNSTTDFCIECPLRCILCLNIALDPVSVLTNLVNKA